MPYEPYTALVSGYDATTVSICYEFPNTICTDVCVRAYDLLKNTVNSSTSANCGERLCDNKALATNLTPGTFYNFEIFACSDDVCGASYSGLLNETTSNANI